MFLSRSLRAMGRFSAALNGPMRPSYLTPRATMPRSACGAGYTKDSDAPVAYTGFWVEAKNGQVPEHAIVGGIDQKKQNMYVARAVIDQALIPGKLVPAHGCAFVSTDGEEIAVERYEVLVEGYWVKAEGVNIPKNSLPAGHTEKGEILYIGRITTPRGLTPGKVQLSAGGCLSVYGKEYFSKDYEIYCV